MKKTSLIFLFLAASLCLMLSGQVPGMTRHESYPRIIFAKGLAQPRVRPCVREDLTIKEGETDAGMGGMRTTPYIFTNISSSACTLAGYPALELLNRSGAVAKRATRQKSDQPNETVTLEPGKTAWFNLNYNSGGAGHMGKPCPTYPKVGILAPGLTRAFVLRSDISSCPRTDLEVSAVRRGMPQ